MHILLKGASNLPKIIDLVFQFFIENWLFKKVQFWFSLGLIYLEKKIRTVPHLKALIRSHKISTRQGHAVSKYFCDNWRFMYSKCYFLPMFARFHFHFSFSNKKKQHLLRKQIDMQIIFLRKSSGVGLRWNAYYISPM